jgi:hypothetical protein
MYQAFLNRMLKVKTWHTSLSVARAQAKPGEARRVRTRSEPTYMVEGPIPLVDEAVNIEALFCVVPRAFAQVAR